MKTCLPCCYSVYDPDYDSSFCLLLDPPTILIKPILAKTEILNETKTEIQKTLNETSANVCIFYEEGD